MKLNKTFVMTALVAAGLFTGATLQAQDTTKPAGDASAPAAPGGAGNGGMRRPGLTVDMLAKQLDLTEDQKPKVKPIVEEMNAKNAEIRKDTSLAAADRRAKIKEVRDAAGVKLKEILTPEQYAKWEKMPAGRRPAPAAAPDASTPPAAPATPKN